MTSVLASSLVEVASFGPFRLFPAEKWLEREGKRVDIGSRALDILIALVERAGESVSNRELMARVWRDVIVEDSSVRVNVAILRRVLGDGRDGARYIVNIPGQGYCFVAPVVRIPRHALPHDGEDVPLKAVRALPSRLHRMVGRDEQVRTLAALALSHRFVSIVGPGGIGKTTTAVATMHALLPAFDGEACFFDLARLASSELVGSTVAATLGLMMPSGDPMPALLTWLRDKKILLVLDNCEHLAEATASLAEQLFHGAPQVHILATSREPLRAEGEYVYRLPPLQSPPVTPSLTAAQAMMFPAVQLFVGRATANGSGFALNDSDAPVIAEICRKLDGIALAIELGASRVAAFGVQGTADLLDNRFRLSWYGRRTALPRHQTLSAMLDWSYNLLSATEQMVLRRASTFVGHFTLEAARCIAGDDDSDGIQVVDAINSLVAKSLAVAEPGPSTLHYRLLESARIYAAEKLELHGEADGIARKHVRYLTTCFERQYADSATFPSVGAPASHLDSLGNIRSCLAWSFSPRGDAIMGIALCAATAPVLLELSLLSECLHWTVTALGALPEHGAHARQEMALQEALAISSMFAIGNSDTVHRAIERGLQLAIELGNKRYELRLLAGMNIFHTRIGTLPAALDVAKRSTAVASALHDPSALAMAEWMLGVVHHLIGNQAQAQQHCESGMRLVAGIPLLNTVFFGYDHKIRAQVALARTLWLRGKPDQALAMACQVIEDARRLDHPISLCIALIYATPVFLWTGAWDDARRLIAALLAHADSHALAPYHAVGKALESELFIRCGEAERGIDLLQGCMNILRSSRHQVLTGVHIAALAEGYLEVGRFSDALSTIGLAVSMGEGIFNAPDALRIQGDILASMPQPDLALAEQSYRRALDSARRQHALGWELRIVTALGEFLRGQGRHAEPRRLLKEVLARFTEGFDTIDYRRASALLHLVEAAG